MVCVFLADGFEEIEALSVVDILRRAEIDTKTVAVSGEYVTGAHSITVKADITADKINKNDITAAVLPGGMPGSINLKNSAVVEEVLLYLAQNDKIIAAICAAPLVPGNLGLLKNKTATCYPGFENELIGAEYKDTPVCTDGNIITAFGPGAAIDFGLELVRILKNKATADKIYKGMKCYGK